MRDTVDLWNDNEIQFARVIAEIEAWGGFTPKLIFLLSESMDLHKDEVKQLIERAQVKFDQVKESLK